MRKGSIERRILYVILLVILLLLLLRACEGKGNWRAAVAKKDAAATLPNQTGPALISRDPAPPPGGSGEQQPLSQSPQTSTPLTADTVQNGNNIQRIMPTRTATTEAKAHAKSEKSLPAVALVEMPKIAVAVPAPEAPVVQQEAAQANVAAALDETFTEPVTAMKFILVRGGCYQMGSDHEKVFEGPMHEVCVDDFYLSKYEVTQRQWLNLMGRTQSNFYFQGKSRPAEWVNWGEALDFIRTLNRRSKSTFRLPTEAEWEYAARSGGQDEKYAGTSDEASIEDFAWHRANSNGQSRFIGMKKPNGLGLHDMSGNVREWCSDWYGDDYYANSPRENPQGPESGEYRVIRGGAWGLPKGLARTTYRDAAKPNQRRNDIGFRLALPAK